MKELLARCVQIAGTVKAYKHGDNVFLRVMRQARLFVYIIEKKSKA